ncbi:MAG: CNNM domain-containing protein [Fuerstiella sp.]|nr:CNNM domain-containing protein [Fuerstiella sp.]
MSHLVESFPIWLPWSGIMGLLILLSAFFSSSETACFFLSRDQIGRFSTGTNRQKILASLMGNPDRLLTGVLFWNLVINLTYFAVGIALVGRLTQAGHPTIAVAAGFLNLLGMIIFGEVLPKSVAVVHGQALAQVAAWPLATALFLLDPLIPLLNRMTRILRRTFWPHVKQEAQLNPADLEQALDTSAALGRDMLLEEQHVLHNLLDLNEMQAEEVMRPRGHCLSVPPDGRLGSTKLPNIRNVDFLLVQDSNSNEIQGVLPLDHIHTATDQTYGELAEPVVFVPWCASLAQVLTQLEGRYRGVAVVVHEHGEMVGILPYEDLIASVLSESPSRTKRILRREPLIEVDPNHYHAEGLVTLRYLARRLRVTLTTHDESLYTLAGLFQDRLERIPSRGDKLEWHGWVLTAIDVTDRGLVRVLAEPKELFGPAQEVSEE